MPNVELTEADLKNVKRGLEGILSTYNTEPEYGEDIYGDEAECVQSLQATLAKVEAALNAR